MLSIMSTYRNNKNKQIWMNQNISHSKFGVYRGCQTGRAMKMMMSGSFNVGPINNICNVFVINRHAIDVVGEFCSKGFNAGLTDGINPAAMCVVSRDFYGSNLVTSEGMRDETYNLRTNFNCSISQHNPYPMKDNECVYNRFITTIRDVNYNPLTLQQIYRYGLIVSSPIYKPQLLDENRMATGDFLKTLSTIECIFQAAITAGHNLLVLTPFGHTDDEVPQEDIIKIYNSCIYKYGHRFKYVIVAVPVWDGKQLFEIFNKDIIKPQELTKEIDDIYMQKQMEMISKNNKKSAVTKEVVPPKTTGDSLKQTPFNGMNPMMLEMFLKQMQQNKNK